MATPRSTSKRNTTTAAKAKAAATAEVENTATEATQASTEVEKQQDAEVVVQTETQAPVGTESNSETTDETVSQDADADEDQADDDEQLKDEVKPEKVEIVNLVSTTTAQQETRPNPVIDLGNGVVLKKAAGEDEGVRNQTLEGFLISKYNLHPDQYTDALKRTIRGFETYHKNMNKRVPVSLAEAAKHQTSWLRTVTGALDASSGEANVCFDVILHLAYRHSDDLFDDRLACRGFNEMAPVSRDLFTLLQTIIVNAANPRTRARYINNQLNKEALGRAIRSENQRRNLLAFLASVVE